MDKSMTTLNSSNGEASLSFYVQRGDFQQKLIHIIAKTTTALENPCILHLDYVLNIRY